MNSLFLVAHKNIFIKNICNKITTGLQICKFGLFSSDGDNNFVLISFSRTTSTTSSSSSSRCTTNTISRTCTTCPCTSSSTCRTCAPRCSRRDGRCTSPQTAGSTIASESIRTQCSYSSESSATAWGLLVLGSRNLDTKKKFEGKGHQMHSSSI